jgi:transcriptional regulator with XRE-family HTH domain
MASIKKVGLKIKKFRTDLGFTQTQTAKKARVSLSNFRRIEKGKGMTTVLTLFHISKALNVELADLMAEL